MARYLLIPSLSVQNPTFSHKIPVNLLFLNILAVFSVFSITAFLCASNKNKGFQRQKNNNEGISMSSERKLPSLSKISICWRKVEAEEEEEEDYGESDEAEVWRKRIMMGERYSGKILYDREGNLAPPDADPTLFNSVL